MNIRTFLLLSGLALFLWRPGSAGAEIRLRVSVKFILDASGGRPGGSLSTDDSVREQIRIGNDIFNRSASGYVLDLVEIANVQGVSRWFDVDARDSGQRLALQFAALANPSVYKLRSDAVNIYLNGNRSSGNCAVAPPDQIILIGQGGSQTTIAHEIGHFFSLFHTQGAACGACNDPIVEIRCTSPGDDEIGDTVLDLECWGQDEISQKAFGKRFRNLSEDQVRQVDAVFFNLMSYHANTDRLTPGQIDRITSSVNGPRFHVASGRTVFVDRENSCLRPEDLANPFRTLAGFVPGWSWGTRHGLGVKLDLRNPPAGAPSFPCPFPPLPCSINVCLGGPFKRVGDAVNNSSAGSRLQIQAGRYNEPVTITKALCLTANGGEVVIGAP